MDSKSDAELPAMFGLTEDEKLAQHALNTLEAMAIDRARRANEDIQQTAALSRILRTQLLERIAQRTQISVEDLAAYDITVDSECVHRDKAAHASEQAAVVNVTVTGAPGRDGTVSLPAEANALP